MYKMLSVELQMRIHHRSLPFNRRWSRLRKRRIRSVTPYGVPYHSESFELHTNIASGEEGVIFRSSKVHHWSFNVQSLAAQNTNYLTIGSARSST